MPTAATQQPTGNAGTRGGNQGQKVMPTVPFIRASAKHREPTGNFPIKRWVSLDPKQHPRRVLWPDAGRLDSVAQQKLVFHDAFERIYREGGWTVAIDELWYVDNVLKLEMDVKLYLLQARALGISLLVATQRPAWVPLEVYDQSTHLFFWRDNDETNLKRLSGISYRSADLIRQIVADLERYQVLYINTRTGQMVRTRAPYVAA